jgi:predicted O-methyltransferase YrrM
MTGKAMIPKLNYIASRMFHRFARIPAVHCVAERVNDRIRERSFRLNLAEKKAFSEIFRECRTAEHFLSFISGMPDMVPHQRRDEILRFLAFAGANSPANVCEIGTADGGNNFLLSQAIPSVKFMLGIDLFVRNKHQLQYFRRPGQKLCYLAASSHEPKTLEKVQDLLAGRTLDLLFIDGDHTYEGVKKDFLSYKRHVRDGGIVAFHDIVPDYKTRYGRETGRWAGEVPLFWRKIKSHFASIEFIENPEQDGLGIGCIEYREAVRLPLSL